MTVGAEETAGALGLFWPAIYHGLEPRARKPWSPPPELALACLGCRALSAAAPAAAAARLPRTRSARRRLRGCLASEAACCSWLVSWAAGDRRLRVAAML